MRRPALALSLCLLPWLVGCVADSGKAERSAGILATGEASIENWVVKGLTTTRIHSVRIDGNLLQTSGRRGVYPLPPGERAVEVHCEFSRIAIDDLYIDSGVHVFRFVAHPATRYRLRGEKISTEHAVVWIEEVATGRDATSRVEVPLTETGQNIQVPVVLPAGR